MPHLLQSLARPFKSLAWRLGGGKRAPKKLRGRDKPERSLDDILALAARAERLSDPKHMFDLSYELLRLERYERAWRFRKKVTEMMEPAPIPYWDGGDLSGRTLLIRPFVPANRVGEELRLSRFIAPVAKCAKRCVLLTEARLVPLFNRSFPGVEARIRGSDDHASLAEADMIASYETIALHHVRDADDMRRSFVPLRPDPARVASLREKYRQAAPGKLIGISWWSSNDRKELPDLADWEPLLAWEKASFVSLQYGDIAKDRPALDKMAAGRIVYDDDINQITDMDGFAAQIAALDAVVSISNTTVDTAGMLAVPTLHIRPDKPSAFWPNAGPSPWYPGMSLVHRRSRPYPEVFAEMRRNLEDDFAAQGA